MAARAVPSQGAGVGSTRAIGWDAAQVAAMRRAGDAARGLAANNG
jgi:hypothetical protein